MLLLRPHRLAANWVGKADGREDASKMYFRPEPLRPPYGKPWRADSIKGEAGGDRAMSGRGRAWQGDGQR